LMPFVEIMPKRQQHTTQCRQAPASRLRTSARVPSADAVRGSRSQLIVLFQDRAFECSTFSETQLLGRRSSRVLMFGDVEHPGATVSTAFRRVVYIVSPVLSECMVAWGAFSRPPNPRCPGIGVYFPDPGQIGIPDSPNPGIPTKPGFPIPRIPGSRPNRDSNPGKSRFFFCSGQSRD
jgi:hypothetical protein